MRKHSSEYWWLSIKTLRKVELCELFAPQTGNWVSRTAMCRPKQKLGLNRKKKHGAVAFAGTERVQKFRVEYWEKIKDIEPTNLVFLDETAILRSTEQNSDPFTARDKSIPKKSILSGCSIHSYWRN
jgi:hypothetical protein